jgi:hypothetical protein
MIITSDLECGSGVVHALEPGRFRLDTVGDRFGYNRYFCVRVENPSSEPVRLELTIHPDPALGSASNFMTHFPSHLWWSRGLDWTRWVPVSHTWPDAIRWHDTHIELTLTLPPRWTMHLATNPPRRCSDVMAWMQKLDGRVAIDDLGASLEGRAIRALRLGRRGARRMFVLAGMHSSEHGGVMAAQTIVDYLLTDLPEARRLRDAFDFAVVPMLNPDGNVRGRSGANTQTFEHNNSMDFTGAARGHTPRYHDNALLWRWLSERFDPDFLLHFHGYMGWKRNSDPPFDGVYLLPDSPELPDDERRRRKRTHILDRLRYTTPAFTAHWELAGQLGPESLEWALAQRHGTLSVLYEINCGSVGISEQSRRGVQVLDALTRAILDDDAL